LFLWKDFCHFFDEKNPNFSMKKNSKNNKKLGFKKKICNLVEVVKNSNKSIYQKVWKTLKKILLSFFLFFFIYFSFLFPFMYFFFFFNLFTFFLFIYFLFFGFFLLEIMIFFTFYEKAKKIFMWKNRVFFSLKQI